MNKTFAEIMLDFDMEMFIRVLEKHVTPISSLYDDYDYQLYFPYVDYFISFASEHRAYKEMGCDDATMHTLLISGASFNNGANRVSMTSLLENMGIIVPVSYSGHTILAFKKHIKPEYFIIDQETKTV